jgi:hypothetical protein
MARCFREAAAQFASEGFCVLHNYMSRETIDLLRSEASALLLLSEQSHIQTGCVVEPVESGTIHEFHPARTNADAYVSLRRKKLGDVKSGQTLFLLENGDLISSLFDSCARLARFKKRKREDEDEKEEEEVYFFNEHFIVKPPTDVSTEFAWHTDAEEQLALCLAEPDAFPYISMWSVNVSPYLTFPCAHSFNHSFPREGVL